MSLDDMHMDVREFCERRDWEQYHTPKELAIGLVTESSELLEPFRFKNESEQNKQLSDPDTREEIEDEVADVLFFLLRFADLYEIDLETALERKLSKNRQRYPQEKFRASNRKYDK